MHTPTLTSQALVERLQPHLGKQLVFEYAGRTIQPGYHVTEIKAAQFSSLDCGANPQEWRETIVQLWDVNEADRHMSVDKFLAIFRKVQQSVAIDLAADVKFECGDDVSPAVHYTLGKVRADETTLTLSLEPVRASCKPRDLWWLTQQGSGTAEPCCTPSSASGACCTPAANNTLISIDAL
jgi:Family of unknown function (DUF6428)